ncbi:hypothetical protein [Paenibacillus sp. F4]|uniref:hypothetical protein n=1 Tax=Paenibacillus sp. F4 TaxID=357385 RepID=UPI0021556FB4|nr:hypothetical protein [Paenibacillus sp. F4]
MRYFAVGGDVLSLVEVKDGFPLVTYQGYVGAPFDKFTMEYDRGNRVQMPSRRWNKLRAAIAS